MAIEITTATTLQLDGIKEALGIPGDVTSPLTGEDDPRGSIGSRCFDTATGIYYQKQTVSPHLWAAIQTSTPSIAD